MKVLVACEFSGTVRDAFTRLGHDAISCDLLPTESPGWHYQGDIMDLLYPKDTHVKLSDEVIFKIPVFDLMIAHPPCTYLASSGLHWNKKRPERALLTDESVEFVKKIMNANVHRIAVENPIGCLSSRIRKPDQIIQPWQFGHDASKATCLWLKNLPLLVPTNVIKKEKGERYSNQTASGQNVLGPSADRWKLRSLTYQGIADAFAQQWGQL